MVDNLRPAMISDSEFCYILHERSMGPLIAALFGSWDETVQRSFHKTWFDPLRIHIIEAGDRTPIGVLDVRDAGDHLYLSRIELLPEYQGHGIGSAIIRTLQAKGQPVRLHVFTANRRARALYERLGFRVENEQDDRLTMSFTADAIHS